MLRQSKAPFSFPINSRGKGRLSLLTPDIYNIYFAAGPVIMKALIVVM
ncbi:hypothetical protein JOC33_003430 [Thalassobacillus pellis]|nr:hypothetical protein [Thalassobacillus pellis]